MGWRDFSQMVIDKLNFPQAHCFPNTSLAPYLVLKGKFLKYIVSTKPLMVAKFEWPFKLVSWLLKGYLHLKLSFHTVSVELKGYSLLDTNITILSYIPLSQDFNLTEASHWWICANLWCNGWQWGRVDVFGLLFHTSDLISWFVLSLPLLTSLKSFTTQFSSFHF